MVLIYQAFDYFSMGIGTIQCEEAQIVAVLKNKVEDGHANRTATKCLYHISYGG